MHVYYKIVKIFECNLDDATMILKNEEIYDINDLKGHFNKCISLLNEYYATIDDKMIIIWFKDINTNNYSIVNTISLNIMISDIFSINNEYLIASFPTKCFLKIFEIKSLSLIKTLNNVDCLDSQNIFFPFHQYILVNCEKGIILISSQTKEIVQYIENFENIPKNKEIYLNSDDDCIYLIFKYAFIYMKIFKLKMINDVFEKIAEYDKIEINEKQPKMLCFNNGKKVIWAKGVYLLKE